MPLVNRRFTGLDGRELSEMTQLSHKAILDDIVKNRQRDKTFYPTLIASIPQIRMTRKIQGEYTLDESEEHKFFDDSVGVVADWKKRGPAFEVPFSTLYSQHIKNLIVSGRCISVTENMWDIMRVIPCCAVTGQVAGTAAAMTDDFTKIDIEKFKKTLRKDKVKIHINDIL